MADAGTADFEGATLVRTSFKGATLRGCDASGVTTRSVDVGGLDIDSHELSFGTLIVNGVNGVNGLDGLDVVPLMEAELDRQFPGHELQRRSVRSSPAPAKRASTRRSSDRSHLPGRRSSRCAPSDSRW